MKNSKNNKSFTTFIGILTLLQFLVDGFLFIIFFTSMDFIRSIFAKHIFWRNLFNASNSSAITTFIGVILAIDALLLITFFILKIIKKFPPTITIVMLGVNCFSAIIIKTVFYIFNKNNIFLDCEIINFFPIATAILATVFITYDFIDYYKGTYRTSQANTTLPTEETVRETIDVIAKRAKDVTLRLERENTAENKNSETKSKNLSAYRTNEGYFNNYALEIAADNMINNQDK